MLKRKDIHLLSVAAAERSEEARKEAARKAWPLLHSHFVPISVCVCGKEMCPSSHASFRACMKSPLCSALDSLLALRRPPAPAQSAMVSSHNYLYQLPNTTVCFLSLSEHLSGLRPAS